MHQVQRRRLLHRLIHRRLGPADRVTLVRAVLSTVVAVLALVSLVRYVDPWLVIAVAGVALVLDRVDGEVARRTGTASAFGARFDMETDAYLLAALSVYVARDVGWWVLLIGAARYLFLLAQALVPRLRRPAPPRRWCKVVAVVQGVTLAVAASPVLPVWADTALLAVALALLVESFVHEGRDRWRHGVCPAPVPRRRLATTVAAGVLLWLCLMVPDHPHELTWGHWVGLPLELLLLAALALVLPARATLVLGPVAGGVIALLAVHAVLDLGFRAALDKPFDPLYDHVYAGRTVELVEDMVGRWPGRALMALAATVAILLLLTLPLALRRLASAVRTRRGTALPAVAGLLALWVAVAATGSGVAAREASRHAVDTVVQVRSDIVGERHFARALADGAAADDAAPSFAPLRGRDVLLVFVESYGRTALDGADPAGPVVEALVRGERRLAGSGWQSRSAWLTSATYGGLSWLAHATVHAGLWVDSERRYDALLDSDRRTLASMLGDAGWRTVAVVPANRRPWPEGERFYGWDRVYAGSDLGYQGPAFGYAPMPDQFTLAALRRLELGPRPGPAARDAVFAEVDLVTSHTPWAPLPRMVPWQRLGDGSVFAPMPDQQPSAAEVWTDGAGIRSAYERSIAYSLDALTSFLTRIPDRRPGRQPVVVVLGDHQPSRVVPGQGAGTTRDVPVTVLSRDPAVLRLVEDWAWADGLRPAATAPVWPMDSFRDRFVTAFDPGR